MYNGSNGRAKQETQTRIEHSKRLMEELRKWKEEQEWNERLRKVKAKYNLR